MADALQFHEGEPPRRRDRQYIALAIDLHGEGFNQPSELPRWCVIQWGNSWGIGDACYWESSCPGRSTSVRVLKWAELPELDYFGEHNAKRGKP